MAEPTAFDLLGTNIDSAETKVFNATTVYSFQAAGPSGEIVFNSSQSSIPGFIADTASLALTASYAILAASAVSSSFASTSISSSFSSRSISSSFASTASFLQGTVTSASYALTASFLQGTASNALSALTSSKISILNEAVSSGTYYPVFAYSPSGDTALAADASTYTYQPSTNILTVTASLALGVSASSINSNNDTLYDSFNVKSINWDDRALFDNSGTSIVSWVSGSLTVRLTSSGTTENTLTLGPPPAGGTGEGGQLGLQAAGGSYTSASFLDTWQDQFRILKGPNGGSTAGLMYMNLHTGNTQFVGAITASTYSGLPNDYLYVTRNTNQTIGSGTWADRDIIFNNSVVSKGISYNTGTGLATLTGGKVYRITARLAWSAAASYLLQYSCYNSSNSQLGPTVEIVQSTNSSNNISDGTLDFIYAPGSNVDIKIRTTSGTSALSGEFIRGDLNTQLIIQQIA
jgi:hypothetical protein